MTKRRKSKRKRKKRAAGTRNAPRKPRNWDNAISVAYIRLLGFPHVTQAQAATQVGVSERTVRAWEAAPWWSNAQSEARMRFLRGGDAAAMRGLMWAFGEDGERAHTSRWWADRRMPELAPPKMQHEHGGAGGEPIQVITEVVLVDGDPNQN